MLYLWYQWWLVDYSTESCCQSLLQSPKHLSKKGMLTYCFLLLLCSPCLIIVVVHKGANYHLTPVVLVFYLMLPVVVDVLKKAGLEGLGNLVVLGGNVAQPVCHQPLNRWMPRYNF